MEKNNDMINEIFEKFNKSGYESLNEEEKNLYLKEIDNLLNLTDEDYKKISKKESEKISDYISDFELTLHRDNISKISIEIFSKAVENNCSNIIKELFSYSRLFFKIKDEMRFDDNREHINNIIEILSGNTNIIKNLFEKDSTLLSRRKLYWSILVCNFHKNQFNVDENIKEILQIPGVKQDLHYLFCCKYIEEHKEIISDLIEKILKNFLDNETKINLLDKLAYPFNGEIFKKLITKIQLSIEEENILLDNIINKKIEDNNYLDFFKIIKIIFPNNNTRILNSICCFKNKNKAEANLELLKLILDNENISINDINIKDRDGNTVLDLAIENSNYKIAFLLARRFKNKNLLLKDENKGKLLKIVAMHSDFNLFLKLYKPEFLDPKSNLYVPDLFENACIGGNKEIIETMINGLKIENLKSKDISKLFDNLYKSTNPNINTINLLTNLVNKNKINNPKNIYDVKKNKGQGSNQVSIYRSFEYDYNKNVTKMTDFVYSKIINKKIKNEQTFLLYKIDYNDSDEKIITYYDKDGKELITAKVNINNEINFIFDEKLKNNQKDKKLLQKKIDKILNYNYRSMDSFDYTLSYLSYAPTQLEEENNVIIKVKCNTIESITNIINESLDEQNKDKTFICDLGIDNHCVQVLISNGKTTIINTGYDFEYIGKEIEEKFQEKYNKKIEVKQFRSSLQKTGNCVLCSKIMIRLLLSQYKKHKNVYNSLSKDLNRLQKLSKDLIEDDKKTEEDKIKYISELNDEDFKKYYNLIKISVKANIQTYYNNKQNFENKIDYYYKKLLTIFNNAAKERNLYDKAFNDLIELDKNKQNTLSK